MIDPAAYLFHLQYHSSESLERHKEAMPFHAFDCSQATPFSAWRILRGLQGYLRGTLGYGALHY